MHVGTYRSALFGPQNMKKSLPKYTIGDREILNKKIHTNPKFKGVAPRTDTGFNCRKKEDLQKEISKYYKITNNEVFSRISLSDLLELMIADAQEAAEHVPLTCAISNVQLEHLDQKKQADVNSAYLLVDVRPPAQYQACRLICSVNHPSSRLARSVNWECEELIRYRNNPEWIIVLYDYCEDLVQEYASTLIHRGYENVYVLSGGLKLARDKFGFPLVLEKDNSKGTPATADTEQDLGVDESILPSVDELLKLANAPLPLCVSEIITEQLGSIILPPLSMKGTAAEMWMNAVSTGVSEAGTSRSSTVRTRADTSCTRSTKQSAAPKAVRPWR